MKRRDIDKAFEYAERLKEVDRMIETIKRTEVNDAILLIPDRCETRLSIKCCYDQIMEALIIEKRMINNTFDVIGVERD